MSVATGRLSAVSKAADPRPETGADPWRAEVGAFRADERRRRFPMGVHVGTPGGERRTASVPWPVPRGYDAGLRLDLVTALLDGSGGEGADAAEAPAAASAWVTRPGDPVLHDQDLAWYSAAAHAFAAYDVRLLGFRAVTRSGWLDVASGEHRVWRRLRL